MGVQIFKMVRAHVDATLQTPHPHADFLVDLGHPLLNRVVDGFVKVGGVGALHAASQDTYRFLLQGMAGSFVGAGVSKLGRIHASFVVSCFGRRCRYRRCA